MTRTPRKRMREAFVALGSVLALTLALSAGPASADIQRAVKFSFGPDGTAASIFRDEQRVAFDQESERFYVSPIFWVEGVHAFDMSIPGTTTALGEIIPIEQQPDRGQLVVDQSGTASQGRLIYAYDHPWESETGFKAFDPFGNPIGSPFPIIGGVPASFCFPAIDSNGNLAVTNRHPEALAEGRGVVRYTSGGVPLLPVDTRKYQDASPCFIVFDSADNLFVNAGNSVWKYTAASNYTLATRFIETEKGSIGGQMVIDKSNDHLFIIRADAQRVVEYDQSGTRISEFGETYGVFGPNFYSLAVNEATDEVYVHDLGTGNKVHVFGPPFSVPILRTERPTDVNTTGARVYGHIDMDGSPDVIECFFQYGLFNDYSEGEQPCVPTAGPGTPITSDTDVTAQLSSLENQGATYHYRLVVKTAEGVAVGTDESFITADPPFVKGEKILEVTADHALLRAEINPKGVNGSWHIEYGTEDCAISTCQSSDSENFVVCSLFGCPAPGTTFQETQKEIIGLKPGTLYHFRFVGLNDQSGVGYGADHTFRTFPLDPAGVDPCPNSHVRKISGASKLTRCRAYELVSAADAGGYDVASNIVEGEEPLAAYPRLDDGFLYTTSVGKLPGVAGFPVNLGTDPYLAKRGPDGWTTTYAGIPATAPSASPFATTLSGADARLTVFAFGEPDRCSPCFEDGSTGIPLRLPNGSLVQGMQGSIAVPKPEPAGKVVQPISADGSHFVFGSEQKFEPAASPTGVTLYDRSLAAGTTQVVSTMPDGSTISGPVVEVDISADGSRILVGRLVGSDAEGNPRYDLYMHVGNSPNSVLVADTPAGVLYNGMSDDGTKVYFTTTAALAGDSDGSADVFRADVGPSSAAIARISTGSGGTGETDACEPPDNWNVAEGGPDCSALAFAGGAGVASGDGTIYFLSPELLDGAGHGLPNQPNVYIARPGSAPHYVGTLDSSLIKPPPSPPRRPVQSTSFGGSHSGPRNMAVDETNGDLYVVESGAGRISRYKSDGTPHLFTAGPGAGTNKIGGLSTGGGTETTIGVDSSPGSPLETVFYTRQNTQTINVYAASGEQLGEITGFYEACGLAVDQATGDLYVGDYSWPGIRKFHPTSPAAPITNADYVETSVVTQGLNPCQVAAGGGQAYASQWSEGPLRRYPMSAFEATPPSLLGTQVASQSKTMYVDPSTGEVYVEQGKKISVYTADENEEIPVAEVGLGTLTNQSIGVAVNGKNHHVFATKEQSIIHFGYEEVPYLLIDHPGVLHATEQADIRSGEDFQVTPSGNDAVFTSRVVLTDEPTDGNMQVFRYKAPTAALACASCSPTGAVTRGDSFLAPNGTNIADEGRVFFTSPEQLTLRDTNRRTDAYEWDQGTLNLISTGTGIVNAALASVDSTGKNAYFFTRESIIPQDDNGPAMKVYTAREGGGYSYLPGGVPCQAADECRGPGTEAPPPPPIGTYEGSLGNAKHRAKKRCKKGLVKRRGRCVKPRNGSKGKRPKNRHGGGRRG